MCSPRCELAVIAGPGENSVEKGEEGVRLAEIGDLLQRAAKSKGEFDHGGKCLQETIRKCCASTGLDCFGAVIKKSRQESRVGVSSGKSTLEELFTCDLISIFSGAACEGGERGKELKRGA